jgi:outer membrane usher protein
MPGPCARARLRRLLQAVAIVLLGASTPAVVARCEEPVERMVLTASLNGAELGDVLAVRRAGHLMVSSRDLERAGLLAEVIDPVAEEVDGERFVPLDGVARLVASELDEADGNLRMRADPAALRTTVVGARSVAPLVEAPEANPSGFANYGLRYAAGALNANAEVGAAYGAGALRTDLAYAGGAQRLVRGLSALTVDDVPSRRRWSLGDGFVSGGLLGGAAMVGGFQVATDDALQPGVSSMPTFGETGVALSSSVLEIYSNGSLVKRVDIPPGPFRVSDLPVTVGANDARIVLRDSFGRTTEVEHAFYVASRSLAPGVSQYAYAAGFLRRGLGVESFDYAEPTMVGSHRVGVSTVLTLGGRLEAAVGRIGGGPSASVRLPVGELELGAGASTDGGQGGGAGAMGYSYLSRNWSASAQLSLVSARYATSSLRASDDRSMREVALFAGVSPSSHVSLGVQLAASIHRDGAREERRASLVSSVRLGARSSLVLGGGWRLGLDGRAGFEANALLLVGIDGAHYASVSGRGGGLGSAVAVEVARSDVGQDHAISGRVRVEAAEAADGADTHGDANVVYDHPYGRVAADVSLREATQLGVEVAGGLVAVGGRVAPTRTVSGGFALIRVPSVEGVRGYLNNQPLGRTDAHGDLVVPRVMPYQVVQLSIDDSDIPGEYRVGERRKPLAVYRHAGAIARFDVELIRAVRGRVMVLEQTGNRVVPKNGELRLRERPRIASPVGSSGQFELEALDPGVHEAEVSYSGGRCTLWIGVPAAGAEPVTDLGELACVR